MIEIPRADLAQIQDQFAASLLSEMMPHNSSLVENGRDIGVRIETYRANLRAIWHQALSNSHPVLRTLIGAGYFEYLSHQYGLQYPSESGDLHWFGQHFHLYLASIEDLQQYPYLSDMAALEWGVHRAYYASHLAPLSLATFLTESGEHAQERVLVLHPALTLFQSNFACAAIWLAHQEVDVAPLDRPIDSPSFSLIYRTAWQVEVVEIGRASFLALQAIDAGKNLEQAFEIALAAEPDMDISRLIQDWFSKACFSHCLNN